MSTLGTGHATEYTRLPISLALLLYLPLILAPLHRRYANLLESDSARVRKRKGKEKKTVLEIANHQPCEITRMGMEIGHKPRPSVLVDAAFNIRSTRPSPASTFFFSSTQSLIYPPTFCSSNSVCRTHSFKVLVGRFTHSHGRFAAFFLYIFLIQNPILIQDAYHLVQLRRCRHIGGSLWLPRLPQLETKAKRARPPVSRYV